MYKKVSAGIVACICACSIMCASPVYAQDSDPGSSVITVYQPVSSPQYSIGARVLAFVGS